MRYIIFFLSLFSLFSIAKAEDKQQITLKLSEKIKNLENELDELRFQAHMKHRVYGAKQKATFIPVDNSAVPLKTVIKSNNLEANDTSITLEMEKKETKSIKPILSPEQKLYAEGRQYLAQQRIDLAKKNFNEIIEDYDGTPEAILSRFWIGEFMLQNNDFSGSSIAFGQAYGALKRLRKQKTFSKDLFLGEEDRLPEILYKLAFSLKMISKRGDACITLRQLKKEYKKRPANLEWHIQKLSKELKCR